MPILEQTGFFAAFSGLKVAAQGAGYSDETFHLCLFWAQVWGLKRLSHLNDQPAEAWAVPLDAPRRPDYDTVQRFLAQVLTQDGCLDAEHPH